MGMLKDRIEIYKAYGGLGNYYQDRLNKLETKKSKFSILLIIFTIITILQVIIRCIVGGVVGNENLTELSSNIFLSAYLISSGLFMLFLILELNTTKKLKEINKEIADYNINTFDGVKLEFNIPFISLRSYGDIRQMVYEFMCNLNKLKRIEISEIMSNPILSSNTNWQLLLADEIKEFEKSHQEKMNKEWHDFLIGREKSKKKKASEDELNELCRKMRLNSDKDYPIFLEYAPNLIPNLRENGDVIKFALESRYIYSPETIISAMGLNWDEIRKEMSEKIELRKSKKLLESDDSTERKIRAYGDILNKALQYISESENKEIYYDILDFWGRNPQMIPTNQEITDFYMKCKSGEITQIHQVKRMLSVSG